MSGHSKWHNIQKTKGAQDAKRAAAFTKIAKELIVAVKEGGSADPAYNSRLATVITKAKAANMPNDNIKRCLEKAAGAGGDNYETITYEGYGPGGVAVIVETMTDNRNRTAGSMRHHFDKFGGNLGATGCVSWALLRRADERLRGRVRHLRHRGHQVQRVLGRAGAGDESDRRGAFCHGEPRCGRAGGENRRRVPGHSGENFRNPPGLHEILLRKC